MLNAVLMFRARLQMVPLLFPPSTPTRLHQHAPFSGYRPSITNGCPGSSCR
jgi:hypothetical protein